MNGFPPPTLNELEELVAIKWPLNWGSKPPPAGDAKRSSERLSYRLTPDKMGDNVRRQKASERTTRLANDYGASRSRLAYPMNVEVVALRDRAMTKAASGQTVPSFKNVLLICQVADSVGPVRLRPEITGGVQDVAETEHQLIDSV